MRLELRDIIHSPGASLNFSDSVDLSDLCYGTSYPVSEPVQAPPMEDETEEKAETVHETEQ